MLAFTLRPLNSKNFFLVARNDWNLSNLKNSYHVAQTMNFTKNLEALCMSKLKWFQITRSRKKYKESGQFEQKNAAFFRLFRREKKSLPPCMSYRYENKRISMYLEKHHFKKMGGGGVGD